MWGVCAIAAAAAIEGERNFQESIQHLPPDEQMRVRAYRADEARAMREHLERRRALETDGSCSSALGYGVIGLLLGIAVS